MTRKTNYKAEAESMREQADRVLASRHSTQAFLREVNAFPREDPAPDPAAALLAACRVEVHPPVESMRADGWATVQDFARAAGCSVDVARTALVRAVEAGRVERRKAANGPGSPVCVYRAT